MLNLNEFIKKMGIFNKLVRRRDRFSYDKIIEWLKSFP